MLCAAYPIWNEPGWIDRLASHLSNNNTHDAHTSNIMQTVDMQNGKEVIFIYDSGPFFALVLTKKDTIVCVIYPSSSKIQI